MKNTYEPTETSRLYGAAHAAHHLASDLSLALRLYRELLTLHPNTREAGYSQTQVRNIANTVVPEEEMLETQIKLALAHLESNAKDHGACAIPRAERDGSVVESMPHLNRSSS